MRCKGNSQLTAPDIIELGMPFTDPIADGPAIQTANTVRRLIRHSSRDTPPDTVCLYSKPSRMASRLVMCSK